MLFSLLLVLASQDAPALPAWRETLGFHPLFDGHSLAGWHPFGRPGAPVEGWKVQDGALLHPAGAGGGDLVSDERLGDFELVFEWRVAPGGNSGLKYRFAEEGRSVVGPEYQVLDDGAHTDGQRPETGAAALYALFAPREDKPLRPAGEWNNARVIARGNRLEHWLNGVRVLATEVGGVEWERARAASKFAGVEDFARHGPGPIALQDHGDEVAFRNLFVRTLAPLGEDAVALFDGQTTAGWRLVGQGEMRVEGGELVGIGGNGKGFLVCEPEPADFVLELELKNDSPANSGVQVRSQVDGNKVVGYQIEVDPSERAWSGGLFEEPKAWIASLEHDPIARTAFHPGEWNHYRIECAGPVIRAWVNGILTCDYRTARPAAGVIAFQLHDPGTRMRWRGIRLLEL
jgi:hypothetical protein